MTQETSTTLAGAWQAREEVRQRVRGLGRVLIDDPLLVVAGRADVGGWDGITAVVEGRLTDFRRLAARTGGEPGANPAVALARAYAQVGIEALALLRGEWLAAIFDPRRSELVLARDPLGGRSVHHAPTGSGTVFGEDARDVLALLPATPSPDRRAVSSWLAYGAMPVTGTLHAGVSRLTGGTALQLGPSSRLKQRVWDPVFEAPYGAEGLTQRLLEEVDEAVVRAVGSCTRPGVLLSGGLDSAIVAASAGLAARPAGGLLACSATFPGHPDADESELIVLLTRHLGLRSIRSVVEWGSPLRGGLRYLSTWKLPSTSPNSFLWLPLQAAAAEAGVEVMLDGQGGDELFDQRPFYLFADLAARGRLATAWKLTLRYPGTYGGVGRRHRARILAHFLRRGLLPPEAHRRLSHRQLQRDGHGLLRVTDARAALDVVDEWSWLADDGPRWWAYRRQSLVTVPQLLDAPGSLRRTAALAALQARHPLMVDQDLVEFALRVPPETSFDPRFDRPLARASQIGRLPDAVRLRPDKSGFSGVLATSLQRADAVVLGQLLEPRSARVAEFVAPGRLDAVVERLRDPSRPVAIAEVAPLWQLGALESWLRQLEDPGFPDELAGRYEAPVLVHRLTPVEPTST